MKIPFALTALLAACACAPLPPVSPPPAPAAARDTSAEDRRLLAFLDAAFDERIAQSPEAMTDLGLKTHYDRLDDYTDAQAQREMALAEAQLVRLRAEFDPARLGPQAQLSYRLAESQVERQRRGFAWRWHRFAFTTMGSPLGDIPTFLINQHRVDSVADAEAYIARLRDVERVMNEISANIRHQAGMGIVPPRFVFAPVRQDGRRILTGAPFDGGADGTVFADIRGKIAALDAPAPVKARLLADAAAALTGPFRRGYRAMLAAIDEVEPQSTGSNGAWSLPGGAEFYAHQLRQSTTTDLSADQIHRTGLAEVRRIQTEMERIKAQVGFSGTLPQFFQHIRTSPEFRYPNSDVGRQQYLTEARSYIAQMMAAAPRYFRRLPRAPLEVRPVEAFRQETAAVAFYNQPSADGSRPGIFYINLADMTQVLRPMGEATAYHEGAPGHHFQIALAQELDGVPKFRRYGRFGAYIEGWGLYSERLGQELGFYRDPMSEFGMLSLELWRAARLVVDTGLHQQRWTREQAIEYFRSNTLLSERDIVKEIERYIVLPGQATSYKIGQLKILELRERARAALGNRFDIREFHAVVLENGAVPLDVLEELVDAWIATRRNPT